MVLQDAIKITKEVYKTNIKRINDEKTVIEKYGRVFNPLNLDNLTSDEFKSFLVISNNKHWAAIHRQGNMLTSDMNKLKSVLKLLLDETKPIKERLEKILPEKQRPLIKGLGRAVLTPILFVVFPTKYAVYNSVVEAGMKGYGIFPEFQKKDFATKYIRINEIINKIASENDLSLWQVDEVWWRGNGGLYDEIEAIPVKDNDEGVAAHLESQLEELLISNWETLPAFKDLEILQEDGELIGQQYDAKEAGRIDLLCRKKDTGDYVVVELKRSGGSDKVVGQTLRYIGWVKQNVAKDKNVTGLIISYDSDQKLKYALDPVKDLIQLRHYKVTISVEEP